MSVSIQSEINRIASNVAETYNALQQKGATMPSEYTSGNLAQTVQSIDIESEHKYITKTLPASGWNHASESEYTQRFTDANIKADYKIEIGLDSDELLQIMNDGVMSVRVDNDNGTAEVVCLGEKPSTDLHAQISFVRCVEA